MLTAPRCRCRLMLKPEPLTQVQRLSSLLERQTATASASQDGASLSEKEQLKLAETALLLRDQLALARQEFLAALQASAPASSRSLLSPAEPTPEASQPSLSPDTAPSGDAAHDALAQSIREAFAAEGAAVSSSTVAQLVAACGTAGNTPQPEDAEAARGVSIRSLKFTSKPSSPEPAHRAAPRQQQQTLQPGPEAASAESAASLPSRAARAEQPTSASAAPMQPRRSQAPAPVLQKPRPTQAGTPHGGTGRAKGVAQRAKPASEHTAQAQPMQPAAGHPEPSTADPGQQQHPAGQPELGFAPAEQTPADHAGASSAAVQQPAAVPRQVRPASQPVRQRPGAAQPGTVPQLPDDTAGIGTATLAKPVRPGRAPHSFAPRAARLATVRSLQLLSSAWHCLPGSKLANMT